MRECQDGQKDGLYWLDPYPEKGLSDYTPQSASDGNEAQPGDHLSGG